MSCSNCFNGCSEIVSDQCVKYTGIDIPVLGIQNGDSLSYVEQALITFLTSTLDGSGIKIDINPGISCTLVNQYLPTCGDISAVDIFNALIKAACSLQTQITAVVEDIAVIEANYTVSCLSGVSAGSGTHAIVQAIITKLCTVVTDLAALTLDVETNYVAIVDINTYIAAYLTSIAPVSDQQYKKMVPYTVVEYYGPLTNFDAAGAGYPLLGWDKVYLCNGANGTPDKRGRLAVGAIQGVPGGGALAPAVDPTTAGNPNYSLNSTYGANVIVLDATQIPSHTHTPTITVTDPGHIHALAIAQSYTGSPTSAIPGSGATSPSTTNTSSHTTGITVSATNSNTGGGLSHNNVPPVLACYYIMYKP